MDITPELAELFGAYVGDGTMYINKNKKDILLSVSASKDEKEWLEHIANLFEQIFCYRPKVLWNSNVYKIQACVRKISEFFKEVGFPVGRKTLTIRAPKVVMIADNPIIYKAFLKGYFDADGCLRLERSRGEHAVFKKTHHYYPRISLCSISKDLIDVDIKHMLESIGLRHSIYKETLDRERRHRAYFVYVNGAARLEFWMKEIGFSNPVQFSKYEVWKKFGFCPPRTTLEQRMAMLSGELDPETFYK